MTGVRHCLCDNVSFLQEQAAHRISSIEGMAGGSHDIVGQRLLGLSGGGLILLLYCIQIGLRVGYCRLLRLQAGCSAPLRQCQRLLRRSELRFGIVQRNLRLVESILQGRLIKLRQNLPRFDMIPYFDIQLVDQTTDDQGKAVATMLAPRQGFVTLPPSIR